MPELIESNRQFRGGIQDTIGHLAKRLPGWTVKRQQKETVMTWRFTHGCKAWFRFSCNNKLPISVVELADCLVSVAFEHEWTHGQT